MSSVVLPAAARICRGPRARRKALRMLYRDGVKVRRRVPMEVRKTRPRGPNESLGPTDRPIIY